MPKVTNAFTTYNAVGNREDLSNTIYNIDPFDTPVMSAIRRRNVKNRMFDWQTEFLPNVRTRHPATTPSSKASSSPSAAQPTIRQNNVTQISERDATVSGSQEETDAAGKGSEMAHQMALASKVLKSDMETHLLPAAARRRQRHRADRPRHRGLRPLARAGRDKNRPGGRRGRRSRQAPRSPACRSLRPTPSPPSPAAPRSRSRKPCSATPCSSPTPTAPARAVDRAAGAEEDDLYVRRT